MSKSGARFIAIAAMAIGVCCAPAPAAVHAQSYTAVASGPSQDRPTVDISDPSLWSTSYAGPETDSNDWGILAPKSGGPTDAALQSQLSQYGWTYPTSLPAIHQTRMSRCSDAQMHAWINKYARRFAVERSLIYAMIFQESRCNPYAVSSAGAVGLMQLMPQFGAIDALEYLTGVKSRGPVDKDLLIDPQTNILLGIAYLRVLIDQFNAVPKGEARDRVVLAAYNWGPARVAPRLPVFGPDKDPATVAQLWTDRIPIFEPRDYVTRVTLYKSYLDDVMTHPERKL